MKKILLASVFTTLVISGATQVSVLEDKSILERDGQTLKVTIQQTLGEVPSVPCLDGYVSKRSPVSNPTWKDKVKSFFLDIYDGFTWKRAAYGLGSVIAGAGAYGIGKKARKEHYGKRARVSVSNWWNAPKK